MYLKTIELYGFKSFANRTKIEFENGVTCIVGPNGSGKSNITDSIKWTLGEQSTKVLRGNKMEDVIFSGTKQRRSLGMAEVILTFDNSESIFDIEYSEVSIKRKLYKNGDSEYYINDKPCRLKDIRDLTKDTGIGKDGYSIIGQGKIDEILNSKPEERRFIFEEAAGISGYREEKKEAEKKLLNTEENLNRIKDILSEIKNQEQNLKIESEKAIKYQELFDKLKALEIYNAVKTILKSDEQLSKIEEKLEKNLEIKKDLDRKKEDLSEKLSIENRNLDELESKLNELQLKNIDNIRAEKDKKSQIEIFNERKTVKNYEILNLKEVLKENSLKIEKLESDIKKLNGEISELKVKESEFKLKREEYLNEKNKNQEKILNLEKCTLGLKNELSEIDKNAQSIKIHVEKNNFLINDREKRVALEKERRESLQRDIEKSKEVFSYKENILKDLYEENKNFCEEIEVLSEKIKKENLDKKLLESKISEIKNKINNQNSKIKLYKSMEDSYEGYYKSIRDFYHKIKSENKEFSALHDTVANLIKVDRKYEKAISTALGSNMQSLVVDTFDSAREIIGYLKEKNIGKITFLPIDNINKRRLQSRVDSPGFIDFASGLVEFDPVYENVINFLLSNVIIAENLESGNKISKKTNKRFKVVTLDGDVINAGGSVTGGTIKNENGIFYRKNEIAALKNSTQNLKNSEKEFERKLLEIENSIKKDGGDLNEKNLQKQKFDEKINQIQKEIYEIKIELRNKEQVLKSSTADEAELLSEIEKSKAEIIKLKEDSEDLVSKKAELQSKILSGEENLKNIETFSKTSEEELNGLNIEISKIEGKINYLNFDNERLSAEKTLKETEIKNSKEKILNLEAELKNLEEENIKNKIAVEEIEKEIAEFKVKNENLMSQKKSARQKYYEFMEVEKSLNDEILEVEKNIFEENSIIERYGTDSRRIFEKISDSYNYSLLNDLCEISNLEKPGFKENLSTLKREIKKLGNVNCDSIISYKKVKERLDFNEKQYKDLVVSKEKLEEFLKKIQVIMQNQFAESFKFINKNFKKVFKDMFGGGEAELKISEGELLDAGIEISATPPGKKTKSMDMLSGGERALTAISLLFAFLESRPAPFCLLDEIDSALDEANIVRFINYLKNMEGIQFLIITHRKTTMNVADIIYGVTMEEPGVSEIISMKFKEEIK